MLYSPIIYAIFGFGTGKAGSFSLENKACFCYNIRMNTEQIAGEINSCVQSIITNRIRLGSFDVASLVACAEMKGLSEVDFDEGVYDNIGEIRADLYNSVLAPIGDFDTVSEEIASNINNGGLEEQIRFLVACVGEDAVGDMIDA